MAGVNKVILIGNLGKDPEVRHLENGRAVASFSLATSETYKNRNGERVTNTEWHNLVLWTPLAEIAEKYLKKGNQIYVEGRLTNRSYDDKDGNKRYITEVVVQNLTMLGGKPGTGGEFGTGSADSSSESENTGMTAVPAQVSSMEEETDDLPF
jgi:single-strand DNA-binding protein